MPGLLSFDEVDALNGEDAADLPVHMSFEENLTLNMQTPDHSADDPVGHNRRDLWIAIHRLLFWLHAILGGRFSGRHCDQQCHCLD